MPMSRNAKRNSSLNVSALLLPVTRHIDRHGATINNCYKRTTRKLERKQQKPNSQPEKQTTNAYASSFTNDDSTNSIDRATNRAHATTAGGIATCSRRDIDRSSHRATGATTTSATRTNRSPPSASRRASGRSTTCVSACASGRSTTALTRRNGARTMLDTVPPCDCSQLANSSQIRSYFRRSKSFRSSSGHRINHGKTCSRKLI
jgi:hypothetical protein